MNDERRERGSFPLTRMIYAIGCAILLYKSLEFCSWFLFRKMQNLPWGLYRFDVWIGFANLLFITIMLAVSLPYRPKADVFRWSSAQSITGTLRSAGWGLLGGLAAFALASPIFWLGDRDLEFVRILIARALSPLRVLELTLFLIALAVSGEIAYRGVMLRTLADYASAPAAVLGSSLLFAYICPALSFPAALILGVVCAVLYYRTRNLLAAITANAVFTAGGGALTLYHSLMQR